MKTLVTTVAAGLLAVSFAVTTNSEARQHMAQREAACKEQAAKKVSAIHFLKRRQLVNDCMGRTAQAKAAKTHHVKAVKMEKKTQPTTTGQSAK